MSAPPGPSRLLESALTADPARPLLTFYDDATGERTELSVETFANWAAKTANLLRDDLDANPGQVVSMALPVHWQAAVWLQAAWAVGAHVVLPAAGTAAAVDIADIAVVGYDGIAPAGAGEVVALGLGPLGQPRTDAKPPAGSTVDYDRVVLGHGDRFVASPLGPGHERMPALTCGSAAAITAVELAESAQRAGGGLRPGQRLLVAEPLGDLRSVLATLLVPLAAGVTAVLVRNIGHLDADGLARRIEAEGVIAAVGADTPRLPVWAPGESVRPPR